jgi:hypothetical protein
MSSSSRFEVTRLTIFSAQPALLKDAISRSSNPDKSFGETLKRS